MDEWIAGFARQGWNDQLAVLLTVAYAMLLGGALGLRLGVAAIQRPLGFSLSQNILWSLANYVKLLFLVLLPAFVAAAGLEAVLRLIVGRVLLG